MKRIYTNNTCVYHVFGPWYIDIVESADMWESWLYHKGIGIKSYMFGTTKEQHNNSLDDYIECIEFSLLDYLKIYDDEYNC